MKAFQTLVDGIAHDMARNPFKGQKINSLNRFG